MLVLEPGVLYGLEDFTGGNVQQVRFTSKKNQTFHNGTTVEDVMKMLIDKLYEFQKRNPSEQNQDAIQHVQQALVCMRQRLTQKIHANAPDPGNRRD